MSALVSSCGKTAVSQSSEDKTVQSSSSVSASSEKEETKQEEKPVSRTVTFRDVYGTSYEMKTDPDVSVCEYDVTKYIHDGDMLSYEDDKWTSRVGVDVSGHQGTIDWKKVKAAGIDFTIIRIGYRGYGHTGSINEDKYATANIRGASAAGLDVGVYFFSQAVSEKEAEEEAELTLKILGDTKLQLPVCFDPENILLEDHTKDPAARTSSVSKEQFTRNTNAFCTKIKEAGYEPMIYCNMLWEAFNLDMSELTGIPVWYADYEKKPQTPYAFEYWQYSNEGKVPGISGVTDMDIQMIQKQSIQ